MELWIRSQNKGKLVNVKALSLYDNNVIKNAFVLNDDPDYSNISIIANDNYNLGTYATKERALEVLEEIQKILKPQLNIKDSGKIIGSFEDTIIREGATYEIKELSTYVYEMPKE